VVAAVDGRLVNNFLQFGDGTVARYLNCEEGRIAFNETKKFTGVARRTVLGMNFGWVGVGLGATRSLLIFERK
jgi:hypothetical protein